jgi:hypothetical protein
MNGAAATLQTSFRNAALGLAHDTPALQAGHDGALAEFDFVCLDFISCSGQPLLALMRSGADTLVLLLR